MIATESDVYIHAAPAAVYRRFTDIDDWANWYPGVLGARWTRGVDWQEDAQMALRVRNLLGATVESVATVRMSVPNSTLVWENAMPGLNVVCTARFAEEVGGCRLTIRKNYHGLLAFLMPLLQSRQRSMLDEGLATLKRTIEKQPRR
jgi:hypothetical protein